MKMPLSNEQYFLIFFAVAIFLLLIFIAEITTKKDPISVRANVLKQRRNDNKEGDSQLNKDSKQSRSKKQVSALVRRLKLTGPEVQEPIRKKLFAAGWRSRNSVDLFIFAKLALPIGLGALATMLAAAGAFGDGAGSNTLLVGAAGVLIGYFLPEIAVKNQISKRALAIQRSLPDGLDLLVICAEAGLSLDIALQRVAREIGPAGPELADELELTSVELGFLPERRQALLNLSDRVDSQAMRSVVNTLLQTEKYGTPLTQSLRVLSQDFREERMLKAEEKAARLPAILTVPMIVFILPTLFIVLIGPAAIDVYDQFMK